jgi:RNA polymerase sigma-70 factor (ECF subfamily)
MRDVTISDVEGLEAQAAEADVAFEMDEESFRAFYERTARPLWTYLWRMTGDPHVADDLLQETYYRFLRAGDHCDGDAHRRAYVFRVATNLVRDRHRRAGGRQMVTFAEDQVQLSTSQEQAAEESTRRTDLNRAMSKLKPRERALLWLAYVHGHPHSEIAQVLGVKTGSVKLLLFRARRKLAHLLGGGHDRTPGGNDRGKC